MADYFVVTTKHVKPARFVKARGPKAALHFVAAESIEVRKAGKDELVEALQSGTKIEDATAEAEDTAQAA